MLPRGGGNCKTPFERRRVAFFYFDRWRRQRRRQHILFPIFLLRLRTDHLPLFPLRTRAEAATQARCEHRRNIISTVCVAMATTPASKCNSNETPPKNSHQCTCILLKTELPRAISLWTVISAGNTTPSITRRLIDHNMKTLSQLKKNSEELKCENWIRGGADKWCD